EPLPCVFVPHHPFSSPTTRSQAPTTHSQTPPHCYDPFSFSYLLILSHLSYRLIISDVDILSFFIRSRSRSFLLSYLDRLSTDMCLPCIYHMFYMLLPCGTLLIYLATL